MSVALIREHWEYHHLANRRLLDVVARLGEEVAAREVGSQFSVPTLRGMLVHVYASDLWWLRVWQARSSGAPDESGFATLGELRAPWDGLVAEQRNFLGALGEADLTRVIEAKSAQDGQRYRRPLGMLLLHVPNHATHHRSEIATMLTMVSGSPPDTGINSYYRETGDPR